MLLYASERRHHFNGLECHVLLGVRHRENLRFSRTKLFGVFRTLFRSIGTNLVKLGLLQDRQVRHSHILCVCVCVTRNFVVLALQDVFYLTVEEIRAFVEGRSVTNDLAGLVDLRKQEYDQYKKGLPPPERFVLKGAAGPHFLFPQLLDDLDLLKEVEVGFLLL